MAIQNNFPAIRPTLLLDFANTGRLDPRITFTRASTGRYYDGVTVAKAEENLFVQSQDFTTTWVNTQTTDTANTEVAPDGTTTADTIADTAVLSAHDISQNVVIAATNVTCAYSCFLKNGTRQYAILAASLAPNSWVGAKFDLSSGTTGSTSSAGSIFSLVSSSITSIGSGWYRCTLIFTCTTSTPLALRVGLATDSTTFTAGERGLESYTGNGSTIYAWGAQLEQRSAVTAYTATTTQPITNYIPVLLAAPAGVARFDHVPTTGVSQGLLIEEQRTNLLLQSEDFSTTWSITGTASISTNVTSSPAGTITADKFILGDTITSGNAAFFQSVTKAATATTYTTSVFVKAAEFNSLRLVFRDTATAGNNVEAYFNAATGAIASGPTANGTFTGASATISAVGNGWYRVTLTGTTSTETSVNVRMLVYQNGTGTATGNGFSGIFIWGAQLEAGAFATSYIPTTTTALTRNADAASMTGTNFSDWFNASEGTLYSEASRPFAVPSNLFPRTFEINDGTANNSIRNGYSTATNASFAVVYSTVNQATLSPLTG
jgi:hypothetical protein